jgi:hypothetical protein
MNVVDEAAEQSFVEARERGQCLAGENDPVLVTQGPEAPEPLPHAVVAAVRGVNPAQSQRVRVYVGSENGEDAVYVGPSSTGAVVTQPAPISTPLRCYLRRPVERASAKTESTSL